MLMHNLQAVFIDRDGTMGGTGHFIHPRDFELFPFALGAIQLFKEKGIKVFALTNQHRIALGQATEAEFSSQFVSFGMDASYICPHSSGSDCECQKPKPGLLLRAAEEHGLDLRQCAVIGDVGTTDMLAAAAVGAIKVLVRTGWGENSLMAYRKDWYEAAEPDFIAADLLEATQWLIALKVG
jgi:histidinol-phosphate phosphatase family protein